MGGRRGHEFVEARNRTDLNVFDVVRDHVAALVREGWRVVIAGYSAGSRDRLRTVLEDHGLDRLNDVTHYEELLQLPAAVPGLTVLPVEHGFVSSDLC
jgi:transcription-repair coupling factor (superfamily II helicase)